MDDDDKQPRPRGRPPAVPTQARREAILEGAREAFLTLGYARTTTAEVAARCRISKRTLYELFPSKLDLFRAIVVADGETMLALPRPVGDEPLEQAILSIFHADRGEAATFGQTTCMRIVLAEGKQFPELVDELRERGIGPSRAMLADWLAAQRRLGAIDLDDSMSGARMLMDVMFAATAPDYASAHRWTEAAMRAAYLRCVVRIFLRGVGAAVS